jgi:amino acid adenylation domain-containing protein
MNVTFNRMAAGVEDTAETGLPELDEQKRHRLLVEWNSTASDFPEARCIHELFEEQALRTPAAEAVVMGDQHLTYEELDRRANQLAHYLRTIGVGPEVAVGLCVERSLEMIVGILGILKSGGAYLPLDKNYPPEHIAYVLKDASVSAVITSTQTDALLALHGVPTIKLDVDSKIIASQPQSTPVSGATSGNLVYVMYTSGSSGKPKGVGVVHYNISRLVLNTNYVHISSSDVFLQLAPVTFDAATFEIWGALLNGAKLVLYPSDPLLDVLKLRDLIQKAGVSILWLTAGLFHRIADGDLPLFTPIKQLLVGGDVISATHARKVVERISGCRVINGYGPTEGTTFSVCFPVPDSSSIERMVPIGRPVSNSTVYVLDSDCEPVPVGATGELYIGGAGLARCYFHRPELTAESFVPNPFGNRGSRLYRTGDMVRYSEEGLLEFLGRMDFQVKVRGYRIELQEIEAALLLDPSLGQAVAVALPDAMGDKRLVAYVVGAGDVVPDRKRLREHLSRRLPEYMIPSAFVTLLALPLTANGKVDRKALPSPEWDANRAVLQTPVEDAVAEIWASTLGVSEIGVDDDFFDLGGTSLALVNIVMKMSKRFAIPLDTSIVLGGATVSALARAVKGRMAGANRHGPPVEQAVAETCASALGLSEVGIDDDFFDLGGTSLALINVLMELSKRFNLRLDTSIVMGGTTVSALAHSVKKRIASANQQGGSMEQAVAEIWESALGLSKIGIDDDFFDLGGTSLALITIVMEMSRRFAIPLDTSIVTGGATVSALARAVQEKMAGPNPQVLPPVEQAVAEIWESTLGVSKVGIDDDFFDLGGTSLALINTVMEMSKRFDLPLDTSIVAGGATVSALARAVKEKMPSANPQGASVERAVAEIWESTLGLSAVGIDDDFFDLGGTSLALITIVMEMSKRFNLSLDTSIVTGGATVSALAQAVRQRADTCVLSSAESFAAQ